MSDEHGYLDPLRLGAQRDRRETLQARIRGRAAPELARRRASGAAPPQLPLRSRVRASRRHLAALLLSAAAMALLALLGDPLANLMRSWEPAPHVRAYATGTGERLELTLKDGTTVVLGADSRLRVPSRFDGGRREVHLQGVARFDVAHDAARPFLVETGAAVTRVLGTQFVIRAYPDEAEIGVAVAEGRVAVLPDAAAERSGVVLSKGQVGHLGTDGMFEVVQDDREVSRFLSWTDGPHRFTDRPLSEVLGELERSYDVAFRVTDPALAKRPLSIRLHGERLEDVLEAISLAVQARYEAHGDTIILDPM